MSHDLTPAVNKIHDRIRDIHLLRISSNDPDVNREFSLKREEILRQESAHLNGVERKRIFDEFLELGPLNKLTERHDVTEIIVNGWNSVWLEIEGTLHPSPLCFLSPETYENIFMKICEEAQIRINLETPTGSEAWRDFRVTAAIPPLTPAPTLNLRRHKCLGLSLDQLQKQGMLTSGQKESLLALLEEKKNVLIVGATGSGKTTLLNAFINTLPVNERVAILEDTDELRVPNACSTKLLTRKSFKNGPEEITLSDLVSLSLRLRPERLVVGEIRGGEAKDLLMALASGHGGSLGTLHADDPWQALLRLEMLIQLGAPQWSVQAIRQLIFLSVNAVVVAKRDDGARKVTGIYQVTGLEPTGLLMEKAA